MTELPTGTVTFLFTDLEGSTRLWEEHPEAMRQAQARHDEILRDAIAANDGHVVKTTGDGVHAAFDAPGDAIAAVRDAQVALDREWWDGIGALRVRIGCGTAMSYDEAIAFAHAAKLCARAGDRAGALADLREAVGTASDKADLIILVTALGRGAEILARVGAHEPAAVLAGFVGGPMHQLDSLPREERADRDDALAVARRGMGEAVYERVARGSAMSLEEVTAYALSELDQLSSGDG